MLFSRWRTYRGRLLALLSLFSYLKFGYQKLYMLTIHFSVGICCEKWYGLWIYHRPHTCFWGWHPYCWLWYCSALHAQVSCLFWSCLTYYLPGVTYNFLNKAVFNKVDPTLSLPIGYKGASPYSIWESTTQTNCWCNAGNHCPRGFSFS